jgi:hypothetical protein
MSYSRHRIAIWVCGFAILFLRTNAISESVAFPTNWTYFKTNIVNDTNNLAAAEKAYRSGKISKEEMMAVTLATLNDEPIEFYGKLQDQFTNPVANASINVSVSINNGIESGSKKGIVISDSNGFFQVSGYHGERLGLMPQKAGYALGTTSFPSSYSRLEPGYFVPDSNNPVVIRMWKVQGPEPLISINKTFKLHYTSAPICFDLLKGTNVSEGGDLRFTVIRPQGEISERHPQIWSVKLEAVDGGLMDSSGTERTTYFAPENGYNPARIISSKDRLPGSGIGGFTAGFYLNSRNGQIYTKLGLSFGINRTPDDLMYFQFTGVANTNRSRNWEGAPNTYLNPRF